MPRRDGTGPWSPGPRTGRGMRFGAGLGRPGWDIRRDGEAPLGGRPWLHATRLGRWLTHGFDPWYVRRAGPVQERTLLKGQARMRQAPRDVIRRRLNGLEPSSRECEGNNESDSDARRRFEGPW